MKTKIIALMILAAGCSSPNHDGFDDPVTVMDPVVTVIEQDHLKANWSISSDFTATEVDNILAAAIAWKEATHGKVSLDFNVKQTEPGPWVISRESLDDKTSAGFTPGTLDRFSIDAEDYADSECVGELWHIAAHEFGHTFGIVKHGKTGVMSSQPSCNAVLDQTDVDLFNEVN